MKKHENFKIHQNSEGKKHRWRGFYLAEFCIHCQFSYFMIFQLIPPVLLFPPTVLFITSWYLYPYALNDDHQLHSKSSSMHSFAKLYSNYCTVYGNYKLKKIYQKYAAKQKFNFLIQNPAYGRHWYSRPMWIEAETQFFFRKLFLERCQKNFVGKQIWLNFI